jgi:hypothetical protein
MMILLYVDCTIVGRRETFEQRACFEGRVALSAGRVARHFPEGQVSRE